MRNAILDVLVGCCLLLGCAVAQTTETQQTMNCTFADGKSITVRYQVESGPKQVTYTSAWSPGTGPMILLTETPLRFGNGELQTGAYSIFLLPSEKKSWTVAVNRDVSGAKYDASQDIARVEMEMGKVSQTLAQPSFSLVHSAPKQCSLMIYYKNKGFWADIKEQ